MRTIDNYEWQPKLSLEWNNNEGMCDLQEREYKLLKQLNHPNIVKLIENCCVNGTKWCVICHVSTMLCCLIHDCDLTKHATCVNMIASATRLRLKSYYYYHRPDDRRAE